MPVDVSFNGRKREVKLMNLNADVQLKEVFKWPKF